MNILFYFVITNFVMSMYTVATRLNSWKWHPTLRHAIRLMVTRQATTNGQAYPAISLLQNATELLWYLKVVKRLAKFWGTTINPCLNLNLTDLYLTQ